MSVLFEVFFFLICLDIVNVVYMGLNKNNC